MTAEPASGVDYEAQVRRFEPEHGPAATNSNDLMRFVYEWLTHFEHAAPTDFYLEPAATHPHRSRSDAGELFTRHDADGRHVSRPLGRLTVARTVLSTPRYRRQCSMS